MMVHAGKTPGKGSEPGRPHKRQRHEKTAAHAFKRHGNDAGPVPSRLGELVSLGSFACYALGLHMEYVPMHAGQRLRVPGTGSGCWVAQVLACTVLCNTRTSSSVCLHGCCWHRRQQHSLP